MSNIVASQAKARFDLRPESRKDCLALHGISAYQKSAMRKLFLQGSYSISEVAKKIGVTYSTARRMIDMDDDLREAWETTFQDNMDRVERAMVDRAVDGRNEIAAQQAGEFLLRHHRKQTYSDSAIPTDMIKALPKIIIAPIVTREQKTQIEAVDVESK